MRGFAVLASLKSLERLILPSDIRTFPKEELTAIRALRNRPTPHIQTQKWSQAGLLIADAPSGSAFWQNWDREEAFDSRLRQSGLAIKRLDQFPDGTWDLDLEGEPISDLKTAERRLAACVSGKLPSLIWLRYAAWRSRNFIFTTPRSPTLARIQGMPIETLNLSGTEVGDLAALRGMPLISLRLNACPRLTDLSPLAGDTTLQQATLPEPAKNLEFLRDFPKLERLSYTENTSSWQPDKTAAEFWQAYDAKKKAATQQP